MASILIVEDRPIDRKFLSTLLKSSGHAVVEASDGAEALRYAVDQPPDLIISDILMPTLDGFELVSRLRGHPPLAQIPVIFYTATYHEREATALAARCGADVLTKPSDPRAILGKVSATLARGHVPGAPLDPTRFREDHVRVVSSALASKVRDLEASEQRMATIVNVSREISAERDPVALLSRVCEAARDVTLAQFAALGIVSDDDQHLTQLLTSGLDEQTAQRMSAPAIDSAVGAAVIGERRTLRLCNPSGRPEAIGLPADHPPTYSCLIVPIETARRVHGYLGLRNKLGAGEFTDADEDLTRTLATHAAIAYENARLYADLQERASALEQEVAERRRVEGALRAAEARTQYALRAAGTGIWEADLASGTVTWSESLATVFGLTPDEAPTRFDQFLALVHPDDRAAFEDGINRAAAHQADLVNEFRTVWPDGTVHWIAGHARALGDATAGRPRMIGVGMDIGPRKSLEQQLRQAQKMEAIGQLAGGIAHDFNNLLTAIRGYADLVLETLDPEDPRRADMDEVLRAADRAASLTRQLLAFSRKQVLHPTSVDLNHLVMETSKMLRRMIGEDIDLVTILAADLGTVRADASQLEQILMNLAVNARDAMPEGGRLAIETANVFLDQNYALQHGDVRPGEYVLLAVSDSGTGMDLATRQRIFEPFFTTKERGRGTGLGLATVYGIVKQSDGYIWVYSEPGQGATFKIYLPRVDASGVPTSSEEATVPATGHETLLLVEDEDAVRSLSRLLLERAGYTVLEAAGATEAEALFNERGRAIDLLVTDVIMPGSSGVALFARLSVQQPSLRVLYMSGYTDNAIVYHAGVSPDVVFLQKPFSATGLLNKVREALER